MLWRLVCVLLFTTAAQSANWTPSHIPEFFTEVPGRSGEFSLATHPLKARFDSGGQHLLIGNTWIRVRFPGASPHVRLEGVQLQPGTTNILIGSGPREWQRDLKMFAQVAYRDLYPGIDLICHLERGELKSDFVVAPGADPRRIHIQYT